MHKYLIMYGPEEIGAAETLKDAKQLRRDRIAAGEPRSIYIVRTTDNRRYF